MIKVEVSRSPRLITLTETLINPDTAKTEYNYYLIVKGLNPVTQVTVNSNSPIHDYVHPDDQTQPTFEII